MFVASAVQLQQEGGVVHGVQVGGIEGDGIAELSGHVDVSRIVIHHAERPVLPVGHTLLRPEQRTVITVAYDNHVHGGLARVLVGGAHEDATIPGGRALEFTGHGHLPTGRNGDAVRPVGSQCPAAVPHPVQRAGGTVQHHAEHVGRVGLGSDRCALEFGHALELSYHGQGIVRTEGQADAPVDAEPATPDEPGDLALGRHLRHKAIERATGGEDRIREVGVAAEFAGDVDGTALVHLHIAHVVVAQAAHVAHPVGLGANLFRCADRHQQQNRDEIPRAHGGVKVAGGPIHPGSSATS